MELAINSRRQLWILVQLSDCLWSNHVRCSTRIWNFSMHIHTQNSSRSTELLSSGFRHNCDQYTQVMVRLGSLPYRMLLMNMILFVLCSVMLLLAHLSTGANSFGGVNLVWLQSHILFSMYLYIPLACTKEQISGVLLSILLDGLTIFCCSYLVFHLRHKYLVPFV